MILTTKYTNPTKEKQSHFNFIFVWFVYFVVSEK